MATSLEQEALRQCKVTDVLDLLPFYKPLVSAHSDVRHQGQFRSKLIKYCQLNQSHYFLRFRPLRSTTPNRRTPPVPTHTSPQDTVKTILRQLKENGIVSIPIMERNECKGRISAFDVAVFLTQGGQEGRELAFEATADEVCL